MYNSKSNEVDYPKSPGYSNYSAKMFGRKELPTKKCGEIFVTGNQSFNYLCTFCGTLLKNIKSFSSHFITYHINQFKNEVEIEFCEVPKNNYFTFDESLIKSEQDVLESYETTDLQIKNQAKDREKNIIEVQIDKSSNQSTTNEASELPQQSTNIQKKNLQNIQLFCFYCDICNVRFFRKDALKSHKIYDHAPPNPFIDIEAEQNESVLLNPENNEMTNNKNKRILQHACKYCFKKFLTKKRRFEHECTHTGDKHYECEICGKRYRQSSALQNHLEIHKNERKYKCEICSKGFNDKTNLDIHIRRHNNDKRYKCSYCDKTFIYNTEKKSHELVHTGVKSYQCAECGLTCVRQGSLRSHILRKHTIIKPFKCDYCDKAFSSAAEKKYHEAIHSNLKPFKCDECDASFARKKDLQRHKKIHSDVFGYVCNVCGKGFKQHAGLYWHKKRSCVP